MKLNEIFTERGYDMVVAVSFEAINRQLAELSREGEIKNTLVLQVGADSKRNWLFTNLDSFGDVEVDSEGIPKKPTISGTYVPSYGVLGIGTVELTVTFTSGTAWFNDPILGTRRPAQDITGWVWGIPIRVNFAEFQLSSGTKIPSVVRANLENFNSEGFAVSHLFCDLQSTDLVSAAPTRIETGDETNPDIKAIFSYIMGSGYMPYLKAHAAEHPFILGYSARESDSMLSQQDIGVPESLRPAGNTFNIFPDTKDATRSTINFIVNTKASGLPPGLHPSTDNFEDNWLSPTDVCDAKMVYSFRAFLETLILRPFYEAYASSMQTQMSNGGISIGSYRSYNDATKPTETGFHYDIYNDNEGDDRFVNSYDVNWSNTPSGIALNFSGALSWYKEKSKHVWINPLKKELARVWAGGTNSWTSTVYINTRFDGSSPYLEVPTPVLIPTGNTRWTDSNGVAKTTKNISDIVGGILNASGLFEMFGDNAWIKGGLFALKLIKLPSELKIQGVSLSDAVNIFGRAVPQKIMLPAGKVFHFQDLQVIRETGAVSMLLKY